MPNLNNIDLKPRYTLHENNYNDINFEKRTNMFKGTIIICVVYGIIAFLLMISTAFSVSARIILFNNFLPFTLVFIIGTILIICLMLYFIFSYIPVNISYRLDDITCPDYWDVELLDDNYIKNSFDPKYPQSYFKFKCTMNKDIFDAVEMGKMKTDKIAYKYTNILEGLKHTDNVGDTSGLSGNYDTTKNIIFDNSLNDNPKYAKLYKNINNYDTTTIKQNLNLNSDYKSSNILNDLKKIAVLQNNYKIDENDDTNYITDVLNYQSYTSSKTQSPINWHFDKTVKNSVGIGATTTITSAANTNIKALILDWKKLTPEYAFNNGYLKSNENDVKKNGLYLYYNNDNNNLNSIGEIEMTSNSYNNPVFTMNFKSDVKGLFTGFRNSPDLSNKNFILDNDKIIISKIKPSLDDLTIAGDNYIKIKSTAITNKIDNIDNAEYIPQIQLYDKTKTRPSIINKTQSDSSNLPLMCDELYPSLLESLDDNNNNIRCAYSKICDIPWSDLRCDFKQKI